MGCQGAVASARNQRPRRPLWRNEGVAGHPDISRSKGRAMSKTNILTVVLIALAWIGLGFAAFA